MKKTLREIADGLRDIADQGRPARPAGLSDEELEAIIQAAVPISNSSREAGKLSKFAVSDLARQVVILGKKVQYYRQGRP